MLSLVLALVAAQTAAPEEAALARGVVVMSSRSEGLTPIEVITLTERLSKALQDAQVPVAVSPDEALSRLGPQGRPELCRLKPECLAERGRTLGVGAVVALDSSKLFDDLPMRIMLLDSRQGSVLLRRSYTVSSARLSELDDAFRDVSQEIKKSLTAVPGFEPPPPPPDAPREPAPVVLTPEPVPEPTPALAAPTQPSRVPVYLTRGGAAVAGGTAVFFLVRGLLQASELQEALPSGASRWKYEQATRLRDGANGNLLLSGVLAGAAGVLLATSFLLPSPEPAEQAPADGAR